VYGELSGHSGNGLVFVACISDESAEGFVSIVVFSYPQPGALDERTAQLWPAGFEYGAVSQHLA